MNESDEVLEEELADYCSSKSLSEDGLRKIFEQHGLIPNADNNLRVDNDYEFFLRACWNERLSEGIIRLLLEYFPNAARPSAYENWVPAETPLHCACENPNVTLNIIKLLIDEAPETIRDLDQNDHRMPLHYLCNCDNFDEAIAMQILKLLIEKHPEAVRCEDNRGELPIHLAAQTRSTEFCRVLIEAYPGSVQIANDFGSLPIHYACKGGSVATVKYLYKLYPDAINHANKDNEGSYPIHFAIRRVHRSKKPTAAADIVQFFLDCHPDVKLQRAREGDLPLLHFACQQGCNDSNIETVRRIIQDIYDAYPESICMECSYGQLPLHRYCSVAGYKRCPLEILKFLIEKHPEGVRRADRHGRLPIHHAAFTKSAQFCRALIEAYPGSEQISSLSGDLPLHYACFENTAATVEYLYKLYPDAVNQTGTQGYYPIHFAITGVTDRYIPPVGVKIVKFLLDCDPNVKIQKNLDRSLLHFACQRIPGGQPYTMLACVAMEVVKTIYDVCPELIEDDGIASNIDQFHQKAQAFITSELVYARQAKVPRLMMTPDMNGRLPLHTALQNNVRLGSIKLLVKGNPSAIRSIDDSGALPLHIACEHHESAGVVEYMLGLADITLNAVDGQGNTTLHLACRGGKHETISLLLDKFGAVSVSKRNADKKLPIDVLWECNAVEDRDSIKYTESVYWLLRAHPEMIMGVDVKVQSSSVSCPSLTGEKRKLGD